MRSPIELPLAMPRAAACLLAAAALAGCALTAPVPPPEPALPALPAPAPAPESPPPAPAMPAPPPAATPDPALLADAAARQLLAFNDRLREMGPADQAREQQRLVDAADNPAAALELAVLLGQTRHSGDLARALMLVEPLARPGAPAQWQTLARLLQSRLAEQRRLEEQLDRQAQQLRDQQRRLDQLSSQLEALKAIERSLSTRPAGPPATVPAPAPGPAAASARPPP